MDAESGDYEVIPRPHRVLDCSGLLCPLPIIRTSQVIQQIEIGQILHLIATDAGSPLDMRAWSCLTGNAMLDAHEQEGVFHFYFERRK